MLWCCASRSSFWAVLGGSGGAAQAVGQILGPDRVAVGLERCLTPAAYAVLGHALAPDAQSFNVPGEPESPKDPSELRRFLFHRGPTTASWHRNGLKLAESRELFACPIFKGNKPVERAVGLIMQGLPRIDWKPKAHGPKPECRAGKQ